MEKKGDAKNDAKSLAEREEMKKFLKATLQTDDVEATTLDAIKEVVNGDTMLGRIKYRRQVGTAMSGKRPAIAKHEVFRSENAHAEFLDEKTKNEFFGFKCLHYSCSESAGSLQIHVQNKKGAAGKVRVRTKDKEATAG